MLSACINIFAKYTNAYYMSGSIHNRVYYIRLKADSRFISYKRAHTHTHLCYELHNGAFLCARVCVYEARICARGCASGLSHM